MSSRLTKTKDIYLYECINKRVSILDAIADYIWIHYTNDNIQNETLYHQHLTLDELQCIGNDYLNKP